MFGRRQPQNLAEMKQVLHPTPDADGVTRVFSKELWDDPKVGDLLRKCGYNPDDARNVLPTADDYIAMFAEAKKRLQARTDAFNQNMTAQYGYCQAVPFLVIGRHIWDGEHGAFMYAQMKLIGYDEWNILMLASDVRTRETCGIAGHPGTIPAMDDVVTKHVVEWRRRYDIMLEAFGVTALGGQGMSREQYEIEQDDLRREIIDKVGWMKPRIIDELLRIQG